MPQEILGIGILSTAHPGHAASYTRALAAMAGVKLVALYEQDVTRGRAFANHFGIPHLYATAGELLQRDDIQAVLVCSPTDQHAELVIAAAQAGKHVLCEKPMATRARDAQAMIAATQAAGVQLHMAFVCRFYPMVQRAKTMIEAGEIGPLVGMVGGNRGRPPLTPDYPAWITQAEHAGGGAVLDHSVHVTDVMRYLSGAEVASVTAAVATLFHRELAVDDCGLLLLTWTNGMVASVDPSWSLPANNPFHYDFFLRLLGAGGLITLDDTRQALRVASDAPASPGYRWEPFGLDVDVALVHHFVHCLRAGEPLPPYASGEDGLRALEIGLAAYEAARIGQPVVLRSGGAS